MRPIQGGLNMSLQCPVLGLEGISKIPDNDCNDGEMMKRRGVQIKKRIKSLSA